MICECGFDVRVETCVISGGLCVQNVHCACITLNMRILLLRWIGAFGEGGGLVVGGKGYFGSSRW